MTTAQFAFTGGLAVADLLLILLLARHVRRLSRDVRAGQRRPWLRPGARVGDFETVTTDGARLTARQLHGKPALVAFFSTSCKPCHDLLPAFASLDSAEAPDSVYAVIVGPHLDAGDYLSALAGKVALVREERRGPVTQAFGNNAFPGLYVLDPEGVVLASGPSLDAVRSAMTAARRDPDAAHPVARR